MDPHSSAHLLFRIYPPSLRPLRAHHPYKRVLQIIHQQQKELGISQKEMNRFLDAIRSLTIPTGPRPTPAAPESPVTSARATPNLEHQNEDSHPSQSSTASV
ncbi:hypothetical protein VKT23_009134 [Stygiomarasmius scandens]|uniref:Uncharacterized protein n=1 Tax=Marasmiellus scandens TaxID=2682957 RepID=A0ABR1JH36_9AGAR